MRSLDESATHILLRLTPALTPVGTIRCSKTHEYYKLSRLAVLKDYRAFRFGAALVRALHAHVRADALQAGRRGPVKIVAHSQIPAKGFYSK